ncbi:UDP-3-O-[3-hydroxymyristoyl] glucosamine N-acyltransferase [Thiohalospira halophila DSM 15071]|uniref:UDP-3-O-acylglucosamine N-acyltransferase n=1 Tax=Thiohalospira halophila DSM 15071 TaxID=1123397 RepID=A0A1I1PJ11_9GAMM|nr:UDP-3-O-(3-hydroxymyristoyl)glucosamine N-acyltransferase [Thiohalospira halophila]SFD06943.1 UDP-3-O-[3-hydroxymyristoyl] glucosamine N-acyltransferase [Thiohalospira halophila DSM 15071]
MAWTLGALAERVGGQLHGNAERTIEGVASLESAGPTDLSFATDRAADTLAATAAGAVLVGEGGAVDSPVDAVEVANPHAAFARIATLFDPAPRLAAGIHPTAVVAPDARVADDAAIGPHAVIESGATIGSGAVIGSGCHVGAGTRVGSGSRLVARVTVLHGVTLGERVILHPGVVVGSDGFGLAREGEAWLKVPQVGSVVIGDDVEIGANTTVDRGALEDTVIEEGAKLDNQIQVAHNVHIGAHTAIAGCVGIAGSARIGRHCALGGGVGVAGHLTIADGVTVTGMSLVSRSIREPGVYSSGMPAEPNDQWNRHSARFRQLDDMARRLRALERGRGQGNQ